MEYFTQLLSSMIHPNAPDTLAGKLTVRTVYLIDDKKVLRMMETYPASAGRNFEEVLRVIDSLHIADKYNCSTPANWNPGDDVVIPPSITDDYAKEQFGDVRTLKPYLRYVADPTTASGKRSRVDTEEENSVKKTKPS